MRTILVCGGRAFGKTLQEREAVFATLDDVHAEEPVRLVVHGNAQGADRAAKAWANVRGVPERGYDPDWGSVDHPKAVVREHPRGGLYNAAAGVVRNQHMLNRHPDISLVIAFPGGKGTADMCRRAGRKGILVQSIAPGRQ